MNQTSRLSCGPIPLLLHGDLLDPWSWLAEQRICAAADELHGLFMPLEHGPFPRSWEPRAPGAAERRNRARELRRAAKEPDAPPFSTELWASADGPQSTAPPHIAVAAARMQGPAAAAALREALRRAALVSGIDVTRSDVILEIASRAGLDLERFVPAFQAPGTARALRADVEEACELGVGCCPSLVINEEWLVSGARSLRDYRLLLRRYLARGTGMPMEHIVH